MDAKSILKGIKMQDSYTGLLSTIRNMRSSSITSEPVPLLTGVEWRYSRLCTTIRQVHEQREKIEKDAGDQLTVGTYKTKNFEMSPDAQLLYAKLPPDTNPTPAEKSAIAHDKLFGLLKSVKAKQAASNEDISAAKDLQKQIMLFATQLNMMDKHGYIDQIINDIQNHSKNDPSQVVDSDSEATEILSNKFQTPPYQMNPDPKKDMDLDAKDFLIRRNLAAQRKIKIIDGD